MNSILKETIPRSDQKIIRIGTRGSALALAQAHWVQGLLQKAWPEMTFKVVIVKTTGDLDQKKALTEFSTQGVFVKELELALHQNEVDFAVHSLKDVPHQLPEGMVLDCFLPREDPRDALISGGVDFADLPFGATIGTGSPRRIVQLKKLRPDLCFKGLRGNVESRIAKVKSGELNALILACAGLNRLGLQEDLTRPFTEVEMVPAIGQGVVAIETMEKNAEIIKILRAIDHEPSRREAQTERAFMAQVGGGCKVPMAALARYQDGKVSLLTRIAHPETGAMIEAFFANSDSMDDIVREVEEKCIQAGVPLPKDLPEHYLMDYWNRENG